MKLRKLVAAGMAALLGICANIHFLPAEDFSRAAHVHAAEVSDLTIVIRDGYASELEENWKNGTSVTRSQTTTPPPTGNVNTNLRYAIVTGCDTYAAGKMEIPAEYEGVPVKKINRSAFMKCYDLTEIIVPDSVVTIEGGYYDGAFENCERLKSIKLSENLQSIQAYTFYGCSALTDIVIPDSVKAIENDAFSYCTALKHITFSKNITEIPRDAFKSCESLESIDVPEGIKRVADYAFDDCYNVKTISLAKSVTRFGNQDWYYNTTLETITVYNPECLISGIWLRSGTKPVIYGYPGSNAEAYANEKQLEFCPLEDTTQPQQPNSPPLAPEGSVFGDVSGDGTIAADDAQMVLRYYVETLADKKPNWYDITGNPNAP